MTDNEIIKALHCCISPDCDNCPYDGDELLRPCNHNMMRDALALIERLNVELESMRTAANSYKMHYENLLPCKVGDTVWAIRSYNPGKKIVVSGKVSEMYYIDEAMTLCIVVKGVCRGVWGVSIFPTQTAAEEYLKENKN